MSDEAKAGPMGQVIRIDEGRIRDHLGEMVWGTVEEVLWGTRASPGTVREATPRPPQQSDPSLMVSANRSRNSARNRSKLMAWTNRRVITSASMRRLNGDPGSNPEGSASATDLFRQGGQQPPWR